jgi:hypothetical protein
MIADQARPTLRQVMTRPTPPRMNLIQTFTVHPPMVGKSMMSHRLQAKRLTTPGGDVNALSLKFVGFSPASPDHSDH